MINVWRFPLFLHKINNSIIDTSKNESSLQDEEQDRTKTKARTSLREQNPKKIISKKITFLSECHLRKRGKE
jgi:hypothetical protein